MFLLRICTALVIICCSLLFSTIFSSCARKGSLTGGPKDTIPPIVVNAIPVQEALNFKGNKVKLRFNEYVRLTNLRSEFYTSPPLKYEPLIYPRGITSKNIAITLKDTLKPDTTYGIYFGNSIEDNHEGNLLEGYAHHFSTGNNIDTLKLKGTLTRAENQELPENLSLLLFDESKILKDSIIEFSEALYMSKKIDSLGNYGFSHLKKGNYQLIAVDDQYNLHRFSPFEDVVGFTKFPIKLPRNDSQPLLVYKSEILFRILNTKEVGKGHLALNYEGDAENVAIEVVSENPAASNTQMLIDPDKKEIHYFFQPKDQKKIELKITNGDYSKIIEKRLRKKQFAKLELSSATEEIEMGQVFQINSTQPIAEFDKSGIQVLKNEQAVEIKAALTEDRMKLFVDFERELEQEYQVKLLANTFKDLFGQQNDAISYAVKIKNPKDYGAISIDFKGKYTKGLVLELLDENKVLIRKEAIERPTNILFKYLKPATYQLKITLDANKNGKYDTGNFMQKILPELIYLHSQEFVIEENEKLQKTISLSEEF